MINDRHIAIRLSELTAKDMRLFLENSKIEAKIKASSIKGLKWYIDTIEKSENVTEILRLESEFYRDVAYKLVFS